MSQLVFIQNNRPVTDSLTVAHTFEKRHDRVLQDIRELGCSEEFRLHHFVESYYVNQQGRRMPRYIMTEQGFSLLVMGYTGQRAMEFKEKYILEFHRMREKLQSTNVVELDERRLRLELFKQAIEHEQRLESVEKKLLEIDHKVETQITLNSREQRILRKAVQKRGMELAEQIPFRQLMMVRDGIGEDIRKIRSQLIRELYRDLWDRFGVTSYADILKKDLEVALGYIRNWIPRQVA
jgi:Rha family phage regulatory protein